ncbi:MAG: glutaredoxin [Deltaproteobacteria bacterium]|nr:glutaredoxin [Deltaproteobacteria bacterium]
MKVRRAIRRLEVDMEYRNILWPPNIRRLIREGGRYQIPCLFIDGKAMYESDDIIGFLREHFPAR